MAKKNKDKFEPFGVNIQKDLEKMMGDMFEIAKGVVEDYGLDVSEGSEVSSSINEIVQIHEGSPYLNEIFKGESWKRVMSNLPPLSPKNPKEDNDTV